MIDSACFPHSESGYLPIVSLLHVGSVGKQLCEGIRAVFGVPPWSSGLEKSDLISLVGHIHANLFCPIHVVS